tara:strand:- start:1980 stop:2864 length:885 start_codon:yes stop_codon:yes gene_type:complete
MSFIAVGIGLAVAGGGAKLAMSLSGRGARKEEQKRAREEMNKLKQDYENLDTSNLAANVRNQYENMENTFEDMTVNQQQARFEAQQMEQQRINTMQNLQGAAGSSGIGALAQALANQGQIATQRASASIGAQEAQIQKLQAGEASKLQSMERAGEVQAQATRLSGAETARGLEYSKTGTLLGMSQQRLGAANQAIAEAKAQQMSAIGDLASAGTQMASAGINATKPDPEKYLNKNTSPTSGYDRRSPSLNLESTFNEQLLKPGALGGASGFGFGGDPNPFSGNLTFNPLTGQFE